VPVKIVPNTNFFCPSGKIMPNLFTQAALLFEYKQVYEERRVRKECVKGVCWGQVCCCHLMSSWPSQLFVYFRLFAQPALLTALAVVWHLLPTDWHLTPAGFWHIKNVLSFLIFDIAAIEILVLEQACLSRSCNFFAKNLKSAANLLHKNFFLGFRKPLFTTQNSVEISWIFCPFFNMLLLA
jgi:hypothetical protein